MNGTYHSTLRDRLREGFGRKVPARLRTWLRHPDVWGVCGILLVVVLAFWREILTGQMIWFDDLVTSFFPVRTYTAQMMRAGHLPLWTPYLWGGFPLFADGIATPLYPLHLVTLLIASPFASFVAEYVLSVGLAGLFMYGFVRALHLTPLAAFVGGVSFMLSGFMVSQINHFNILGVALWLPLILWMFELCLQRQRWRYAAFGGLAQGAQVLGGHPQIVLMSLLALLAYGGLRCLVTPTPDAQVRLRSTFGRIGFTALVLVCITGIGMGVGAFQMIPFAELFSSGIRVGVNWGYESATQYSYPPHMLINVVMPFFFRVGLATTSIQSGWGFLLPGERFGYAGAAVLWLAAVALAVRSARRRYAAVIAVLALVFLILAMGHYTPVYGLVYALPGISGTRVPARFLYLFGFYTALLAAIGMNVLQDAANRRQARGLVWSAALSLPIAIGLIIAAMILVRVFRPEVMTYLRDTFANLRDIVDMPPEQLYQYLVSALNIRRFDTAIPLILWGACCTALVAWYKLPRPEWGLAGLAVLVAICGLYGADMYARLPVNQVKAQQAELASRLSAIIKTDGLDRVYPKRPGGAANILLPYRLAEADGYTLVMPVRHQRFARRVTADLCQGRLRDLWGVRYLWVDWPPDWRSFGAARFSTGTPVFVGSSDRPRSQFALPPNSIVVRITLIFSFEGDPDSPDMPVGELVLHGADGQDWRFPVQSGTHVDGPIYAASFDLPAASVISRIELRMRASSGQWNVYGLTLIGSTDSAILYVPSDLNEECGYSLVHADDRGYVLENLNMLPRAFLVSRIIAAHDPADILPVLASPSVDLARVAVTEGLDPALLPEGDLAGSTARITRYQDTSVDIEAVTESPALLVLTDSFYPGWKAFVDGARVPIYRTDYLFRGVLLSSGIHRVHFEYDPLSFRVGVAITLLALLVAIALIGIRQPSRRTVVAGLMVLVLVQGVIDWDEMRRVWDASSALADRAVSQLRAQYPSPPSGARVYWIGLPPDIGPAYMLNQPLLSRVLLEPAFPGRNVTGSTQTALTSMLDTLHSPWQERPGVVAYWNADDTIELTPFIFGGRTGGRLVSLAPVQPAAGTPAAVFDGWLEFRSASVITHALDMDRFRWGGSFLRTDWQLRAPAGQDYTLFVHFTSPDGKVIAQADHDLSVWSAQEDVYLSQWPTGVMVSEFVNLPAKVLDYTLPLDIRVGVWRPDTGQHLSLASDQLPIDADGRLIAGHLTH